MTPQTEIPMFYWQKKFNLSNVGVSYIYDD
jgi:hypothetical protein